MAAFLVCLIACFVAGLGSRIQFLAAGLATRFAGRTSPIVSALAAVAIAAFAAAGAGQRFSAILNGNARLMLVGLSLLFAGISMLLPAKRPGIGSGRLGSVLTSFLLLLPHCLLDGGAFIITAATAYWLSPILAAIGGGAGMFGALILGFLLAGTLDRLPLRWITRGAGVLFAMIGFYLITTVV